MKRTNALAMFGALLIIAGILTWAFYDYHTGIVIGLLGLVFFMVGAVQESER